MSFESLLAGELEGGIFTLPGGRTTLRRLFGSPLPNLPPGGEGEGGEIIAVHTDPELRAAFSRCLGLLVRTVEGGRGALHDPVEKVAVEAVAAYEEALAAVLRHVMRGDRRQGLVNLFWLAHGREVAECIEEHYSGTTSGRQTRYQLHPLLSGLYGRVDKSARGTFGPGEAKRIGFQLGHDDSGGLVRAILDDQLPLTEIDPGIFQSRRVLVPENRRFLISASAYEEIAGILRRRIEKGVENGERALLEKMGAEGSADTPRFSATEMTALCLWHRPTVQYLFSDLEGVALPMTRSRTLKKEAGGGGRWPVLLGAYLDLADCIMRGRVIARLRRGLKFTQAGHFDGMGEGGTAGKAVYRFTEGTDVASDVRKVTVLFGDVRDFTRASDGAVSERALAEGLYELFDPSAIVIGRFGGRVDKYLGDGFMATFGAEGKRAEAPLSALRAAVTVQQMLERLRELKKTDFRMGLSLHCGRVAMARFLISEGRHEVTPIGRQVNIAGRLSSTGQTRLEKTVLAHRLPVEGVGGLERRKGGTGTGGVGVDERSTLVNDGIAVSGAFLRELGKAVDMKPFREEDRLGYRFLDRPAGLNMVFGYLGEARFKGLDGTVSIYRVTSESERPLPQEGFFSDAMLRKGMDEGGEGPQGGRRE